MEDEKDETKQLKRKWLIHPHSKVKKVFDHIVLLCIFYVAVFSSFKLSFVKTVESPLWEPAEYFCDFIFTLDLIATFFTPKFINNELVENHKTLALKYLRFWFWLDLISVLPYKLVFDYFNFRYEILVTLT